MSFREDELVKRVYVQIIDAIEYYHSRGVYHRDLKPENILVSSKTGEFDVFVADFGLSMTSKMTASPCGTPYANEPWYVSLREHQVIVQSLILNPVAESLDPHHTPCSTIEGTSGHSAASLPR